MVIENRRWTKEEKEVTENDKAVGEGKENMVKASRLKDEGKAVRFVDSLRGRVGRSKYPRVYRFNECHKLGNERIRGWQSLEISSRDWVTDGNRLMSCDP